MVFLANIGPVTIWSWAAKEVGVVAVVVTGIAEVKVGGTDWGGGSSCVEVVGGIGDDAT